MDGRGAGGREEPNLLRSDANDMKSHSLSPSLSLRVAVRLIVHWIMSRGEEERGDGGGDAGDGEVGGAEAAVAVRADHVTD